MDAVLVSKAAGALALNKIITAGHSEADMVVTVHTQLRDCEKRGVAMREASPKVLFVGNGPDGSNVADILGRFAAVTQVQDVPTVFAEDRFDAVFCGWKFAKGTWRDVLERAQKLDPKTPVIVLSHCGCEEQWIEALQAGAFDFLVPPYTSYQILSVLEHAIASRRSARAAA